MFVDEYITNGYASSGGLYPFRFYANKNNHQKLMDLYSEGKLIWNCQRLELPYPIRWKLIKENKLQDKWRLRRTKSKYFDICVKTEVNLVKEKVGQLESFGESKPDEMP